MASPDIVDATGQHFTPGCGATRLISLVPSLTECLFDLGAGDRVVGVTDWCAPALPPGADPPRVGGVRDPRLDDLRQHRPDLVLACVEENRREDVEALRADGIPVFVVHPTDLPTTAAMVRDLGRLLGVSAAGESAARDLEDRRRAVADRRRGETSVRVVYPVWHRPWMTIGAGTYAAALLADAGAVVVGAAGDGAYPPLDLDAAAAAHPDVLLLPDEPADFHGTPGKRLAAELARRCPRTVRTVEVDGRLAVWYGTRSGRRLERLAELLFRG
jgi:ABC-type Fe3+-hydroxamate transport system substrate-binding protein